MGDSLCDRIKKMKSELQVILKKKSDGTFTNQDMLDFIARNNLNFKNETNISQQNVCLNLANSFSTAYAGIKDGCVSKIQDICNSTYNNPVDYDNCYESLMPTLENINQANQSEIVQNCEITSLLDSELTKNNEELALTLNMILGNYEPKCDSLTSLQILGDSSKFVKELNLCINQAISSQKNVVEGCYMNNVNQNNFSKIMQNCTIKNDRGGGTPAPSKQTTVISAYPTPETSYVTTQNSTPTPIPTISSTPKPSTASTPPTTTAPDSSSNAKSISIPLWGWLIGIVCVILILLLLSFSLFKKKNN